jgi:hypothetical protein
MLIPLAWMSAILPLGRRLIWAVPPPLSWTFWTVRRGPIPVVGLLPIVVVGLLPIVVVGLLPIVVVGLLPIVVVGLLPIVVVGLLPIVVVGLLPIVVVGLLPIVVVGLLPIVVVGLLPIVVVGLLPIVVVGLLLAPVFVLLIAGAGRLGVEVCLGAGALFTCGAGRLGAWACLGAGALFTCGAGLEGALFFFWSPQASAEKITRSKSAIDFFRILLFSMFNLLMFFYSSRSFVTNTPPHPSATRVRPGYGPLEKPPGHPASSYRWLGELQLVHLHGRAEMPQASGQGRLRMGSRTLWKKPRPGPSPPPRRGTQQARCMANTAAGHCQEILCRPNPSITMGETGGGGRRGDPWPLRPIWFHPQGAGCRGEAPPRPYLLVTYPHVIDGLGCR